MKFKKQNVLIFRDIVVCGIVHRVAVSFYLKMYILGDGI